MNIKKCFKASALFGEKIWKKTIIALLYWYMNDNENMNRMKKSFSVMWEVEGKCYGCGVMLPVHEFGTVSGHRWHWSGPESVSLVCRSHSRCLVELGFVSVTKLSQTSDKWVLWVVGVQLWTLEIHYKPSHLHTSSILRLQTIISLQESAMKD